MSESNKKTSNSDNSSPRRDATRRNTARPSEEGSREAVTSRNHEERHSDIGAVNQEVVNNSGGVTTNEGLAVPGAVSMPASPSGSNANSSPGHSKVGAKGLRNNSKAKKTEKHREEEEIHEPPKSSNKHRGLRKSSHDKVQEKIHSFEDNNSHGRNGENGASRYHSSSGVSDDSGPKRVGLKYTHEAMLEKQAMFGQRIIPRVTAMNQQERDIEHGTGEEEVNSSSYSDSRPSASTNMDLVELSEQVDETSILDIFSQPVSQNVMMDVDSSKSSSAGGSTSPLIEAFLVGGSQFHMGSAPPSQGESELGEERPSKPRDVPPEETVEIAVAHQVNLFDLLQNRSIQIFIGFLLCLVVSISVVSSIVIVLSRPDNSPGGNTPEEDLAASSLFDVLPNDTQVQIRKSFSAQNRSYEWVVKEYPNLSLLEDWEKQQLFAVTTFFYAFNISQGWDPEEQDFWMNSSSHECDWAKRQAAINIDCNEKRIVKLQVNEHLPNFSGTIPPELAMLPLLQDVTIKDNNLTGDLSSLIPKALVNHSLTSLHLTRTRVSGDISNESVLFFLPKLSSLDLSWNNLGGSLPDSQWSRLTDLKNLDLSHNEFTSDVPGSFEQLTALENLFLQNTAVTGTIQEDVCSISNDREIRVDCDSVGCDATCCECSLQNYTKLPNSTLAFLQDSLSPQARAYAWLEKYPPIVFKLWKEDAWKLHQLYALATFYYSLNGDEWPSPVQGSNSRWLTYSDPECEWGYADSLSGNLCREGRFRRLALRKPSDSDEGFPLHGTIPQEIAMLTSLESITIFESELSLPLEQIIPSELRNLAKLTDLTFARNRISGTIPDNLISILPPGLTTLDLRDNMINGTIPTMVASLSNLTFLDLSENILSGSIPRELAQLTSLIELNLAGNCFNPTNNGVNDEDEVIIDTTTNATMGEFMALAVGKAIMPIEVCDLPNLEKLVVECGKVACPFGCDCICADTTIAERDFCDIN